MFEIRALSSFLVLASWPACAHIHTCTEKNIAIQDLRLSHSTFWSTTRLYRTRACLPLFQASSLLAASAWPSAILGIRLEPGHEHTKVSVGKKRDKSALKKYPVSSTPLIASQHISNQNTGSSPQHLPDNFAQQQYAGQWPHIVVLLMPFLVDNSLVWEQATRCHPLLVVRASIDGQPATGTRQQLAPRANYTTNHHIAGGFFSPNGEKYHFVDLFSPNGAKYHFVNRCGIKPPPPREDRREVSPPPVSWRPSSRGPSR